MNRIIPLLALFVSLAYVHVSQAADRPNVIVVMTDDQGYGEFSCNGNPIAKTPNIDQLAAASVRLTDFHVSPMCTPTRGQLMTGLDAFRNGAINVSSGRTLLRPELKTMADVFRAAGYRTGHFGKWHLGDNYPFRPEDRGFDEAVWFPSSHINSVPDHWDNDYFDDTYIHNTKPQQYEGYCTDVFFREAMKWVDQREDDRPFFAYIALNAAHWPWFVPDQYRAAVRKSVNSHPKVTGHLGPQKKKDLISFLAMGANIDDNIGKLDQFLEANDLKRNTIVVFLTDNGSTMGHDYYNAGMKGHKTQLWEGGHRVPCFIRWPAGLNKPRDIDQLCHVQDLLPTLADLAGAAEQLPPTLDGVSLKSLLQDDKSSAADRTLVINYSRMPTFKVKYTDGNPAIPQRNGACVMWHDWRLLENRELYNVKTDAHQDHDVAADHPEVVAKMRSHLNDWWDGVKEDVLTPQRVIIGADAENPLLLSGCEWLDVFVDQQVQIRRGVLKNGAWQVTVAQPGTYQFELRRWPRESGLKLSEGCPELKVTDGTFVSGAALPIHSARLRVNEEVLELADSNKEGTAFVTQKSLSAGPTELQTYLVDDSGKEICGAYYLYVERLAP
ncbi:arylsulfatase [Blastopirellula sp. JC732]|uniref:Arylsulfatase n=1 Tax=Blastopirellula sediminis TaxID=2894196 RepID=A0A9X1SIZ4_9BACT|nr:arylsulfatase [Blastopirellula sediminis]MCC9608649.1 arylsulfatase [Blastopirellula sediminis]MCC9628574.1 arylsulfatase [Blastopirellula sediminis]